MPPGGPVAALRTITTARAAHNLSSEEAARAYPIHLRGIVTYFDTDTGSGFGALYVHDASGSIFVKIAGGAIKSLPIGSLVDVEGVSDPGGFAPVVDRAQVRAVGLAALPKDAAPVSRTILFSGGYEGQLVEVEGVVRSVSSSGHMVTVELAMMDGMLFTTSVREPEARYASLVDAKVRIRGNEAPLYNNLGQMIGARVMFPNVSSVQVIEPAPANPFQAPIVPIRSLMRWDQVASVSHRVHLRGRVTMQWPGFSLCIRDATRGICAQTTQPERIPVGNEVDVVGFAGAENSTAVLFNAVFRKAGDAAPVSADVVTADQVMLGRHNSELIQIEGQLIGRDFATSDTTLLLTSGNFIFTAVLPKVLTWAGEDTWKNGSKLRITGMCSVQYDAQLSALKDGAAVPKSFRVLMRSPMDVVVVREASWWTPLHASVLLAMALCITLAVLVWVMVLRKRVEQQASLLRESEERFRHMALHDSLTGLATRLLLRDRLSVALESTTRHRSGLAVLMVDLDRFKEINDTHGHQAGDDVLRVTAQRLLRMVRREDTVARIGGDEFVVLVPHLADQGAAERIAAKIVGALAVPIPVSGGEAQISVSVGICASADRDIEPDELLRKADAALYAAKARGRNRFEVFHPEVPCSVVM